jgi:hypothetical protein
MMRLAYWCIALIATHGIAFAEAPLEATLTYETYAAGLHIAETDVGLGMTESGYKLALAYHTTGLSSLFMHGHQSDTVTGSWAGLRPRPAEFLGIGRWRGEDRIARIDFSGVSPVVRELRPTNEDEREPVPDALRRDTIDGLSALVQLVRTVARTGRCDGTARTFDGRRAVEVQATTVGQETVSPSGRSIFGGPALRCDFVGWLVAGFKRDEDRTKAARPLRGSAWLAPLSSGGTPLPVRISFQTRWMGDMTMYLTNIGDGATIDLARHQR